MSYWKADDNVRVGETKVSIPSENGLNYNPGQKIQIFVDSSNKFIDGRECYLDFDFKIKLPAGAVPTRLQLDKCSSVLLRNLRIYDGSRGNLLEELSSYDSYVSVKYDYDKDKNIQNYRSLTEGCAVYQPGNRGTEGTTQTEMNNTLTNPYFKRTSGNQSVDFSDTDFLTCKINLPIHSGIFANSDSIFPVMMTNGLYIEIDTNDASSVLNQLDGVNRNRRTELAPVFHSLNGSSAPDDWVNGSATDTFYISRKNNLGGTDSVAKFPFVVGETFNFCQSGNNGSGSVMSAVMTILEINLSTASDAGAGLIEVKTTAAITNNGQNITSEDFVMYSTACDGATSYDASYLISNVNLVISQVHLDPSYEKGMIQKVREGKAIEFDISTWTNYKHSIQATDRQAQFQIFANNSRAKSLLVLPQDSSVYNTAEQICGKSGYVIKGSDQSSETGKDPQDTCLINDRSNHSGIIDYLSSYQYVINGKRVPSREVSTKKIATRNSIDAFHIYELEKCLDNSDIDPKSFSGFLENFCFGRGFSAGGQRGAMDLRGKDLQVILKYQEATAPTKGKLFNSYVFHLRRLMIRDSSVEVVF